MNFFILLLVAAVITAVTELGKQAVNFVVNTVRQFMGKEKQVTVKSGLPIAIALGIVSGIALQMGFVDAVLELTSTQAVFTEAFTQVDIGFTCAMLSSGSGSMITVVERNQENKKRALEAVRTGQDEE